MYAWCKSKRSLHFNNDGHRTWIGNCVMAKLKSIDIVVDGTIAQKTTSLYHRNDNSFVSITLVTGARAGGIGGFIYTRSMNSKPSRLCRCASLFFLSIPVGYAQFAVFNFGWCWCVALHSLAIRAEAHAKVRDMKYSTVFSSSLPILPRLKTSHLFKFHGHTLPVCWWF